MCICFVTFVLVYTIAHCFRCYIKSRKDKNGNIERKFRVGIGENSSSSTSESPHSSPEHETAWENTPLTGISVIS